MRGMVWFSKWRQIFGTSTLKAPLADSKNPYIYGHSCRRSQNLCIFRILLCSQMGAWDGRLITASPPRFPVGPQFTIVISSRWLQADGHESVSGQCRNGVQG